MSESPKIYDPYSHKLPPLQKLEFYSLGKATIDNRLVLGHCNKSIADSASNIFNRNYLNLNGVIDKENHFLTSNNHFYNNKNAPIKSSNNYLDPLGSINLREKSKNSSELLNQRLYHNVRSKNYSSNFGNSFHDQNCLNKDDYLSKRNSSTEASVNINNGSKRKLEENNLYFDKNNKVAFKYPPGYFVDSKDKEKQSRTKISSGSPEWFQIVNEKKIKEFNENINKEETLFIVSRYQSWITVTPRSKNRKRPLEKLKATNMEETSRVMPNWMQIKHAAKTQDIMVSNGQKLFEKGAKKQTFLVDRQQINKSIFSIGDFRHNVETKENADINSSSINQSPKNFIEWRNNEKIFNPNLKKDSIQTKIDNFMNKKEDYIKKNDQKFIKRKNFNL